MMNMNEFCSDTDQFWGTILNENCLSEGIIEHEVELGNVFTEILDGNRRGLCSFILTQSDHCHWTWLRSIARALTQWKYEEPLRAEVIHKLYERLSDDPERGKKMRGLI